jgi:predicted metal-dependent peptidase
MTGAHADAGDLHAAERDRVRAVRMQLVEHHPFWAYLLMQVELVFDDQLPAYAATDCVRYLWLNPARTARLSPKQLGFVLMHEVGHQVHAVDARMQGRVPRLWHQAIDYVINRVVARIPHSWRYEPLYEPPPGALLNARYDTLVAETIYERLVAAQPADTSRHDDVDGQEHAEAEESEDGREAPEAEVEPPDNGVPPRLTYRTSTGHVLEDFDGGVDLHAPMLESVEVTEQLQDRLHAAAARYEAEGARGDIPGALQRLFATRAARVPWQRVLRQYANQYLSRDEYDPRRPNKRWASEGFLVPGLGGERTGHIVVAIDTSGSMTPALLDAALSEVAAIARESAEVTVIVADATVHEVVTLDDARAWLSRRKLAGGGGTDHRPVFTVIAARRMEPDLFIGLTDLESEFPERAPAYPVLWVVPTERGEAPWGQVVEVR